MYELLTTITFEASYIHGLLSYMNHSVSFWLLLKAVALRLCFILNLLKGLVNMQISASRLQVCWSRVGTKNLHFK